MVHKFKNRVDNFLFSEMPIDSLDYERKGGCFVTISKGVILTILFVIFGFILGLLVFYTTKHAYQNQPPISLDEFIENFQEEIDYVTNDTITPKHYRLILNPMLNDTENQFAFNGNVWITITPNDDNTRTIELDVKNLDIRAEDVSVYRSRILSDLDFQLENDRGKRSAKLIEDDVSIEDERFDMLMNSTEWIDSNVTSGVEKESQESVDVVEQNSTATTTDGNKTQNSDGSEIIEDSASEPSVTEYNEYYDNITTDWDGLLQNDLILTEPNPDDQTELQIDGIQFSEERQKLFITLSAPLRKGHYYIVKVFFGGNMTDDYGFVHKSYDDAESSDNFIAATITDPHHTSALFPCFNTNSKEVTFELNIIRRTDHQSVSVSKLMRSQEITNDWTLDAYSKTSPMKLNNFGFVITNIEAIIVTVTPNLMLNSYFRPKILPSITFIDSEIPSLLKKLETYTNVTYPLESINFIGHPSSSTDIIEIKEGLIIASESFFVAHDEADKRNKAQTVSHTIAKLWSQPWEIVEFGDQEWVNEALPLQLKLISDSAHTVSYFNSEMMIEKRMESMMKEESLLEFNLQKFSNRRSHSNWIDVVQCKGLYLLEILENLLTEPAYQIGIQRFFKSNGPTNFIETLTNLTKDVKLDQSKLVEPSIQEWSHQIGYPLVHIQKMANQIQIQETEFRKFSSHFWTLPITINNQTLWLQKNSMNFNIDDNNWLTVKSNGYFRVNYDDDQWQTILKSLRMDYNILSTNDRAILMDDALNLAKYNYLNYSIVQELLTLWNEQETEYLPWKSALINLEFVYKNSIDFPFHNNSFNSLLRNLTQRTYQNIVRSPLGGFSYKLKILIKKWSCQIFALSDCVADDKKDFQNLIINDTLKRSQRSSNDVEQLYCTVIRFGDVQNWNLVRSSLDRNNNHDYNEALIYSLGCSTDHRILAKYFQLLFDINYKDYAASMFRSLKDNQIGKKYALEHLYTNFQELYKIHGLNTLKELLKGISTQYDYKLFQLFFSSNASLFTSKDRITLAEIVNSIKSNLNWKENFAKIFNTP